MKLAVLVCKSHLHVRTIESAWFKSLMEASNPKIKVPSRRTLMDKILPHVSNKVIQKCVFPSLEQAKFGTLAFDL